MNNILIVDDDSISLSMLEMSLENLNYKIKSVNNTKDALAELQINNYQVLITDMCIPNEQDGLNFINKVHEEDNQIIIIVISSQTDINFVIKVLSEKKVYDYLLKPIQKEIVQHSVEKSLEIYNLRKKKDEFTKQEEKAFKDIIEIFDWKKEINNKYVDSIAPELIRQINISMLQGSGIGSLSSALSIFLNKAVYQFEQKNFSVPEKIFHLIKKNYEAVNSVLLSLSDAQAIIHETENYSELAPISNILGSFKETKDELQPMLDIKNQKIKLSELPHVTNSNQIIFNKEKMKIIIHELFINAMKYSGLHDNIYVLFFSNQDSFDVKILNKAYSNSDGTVGINQKNESRIFEPFFRLQSVVDDNYSMEKFKFGLGLTVVKKILQLHGADISVYSVKNNIDNSELDVCVWLRFPYIK